MAVKSVVKSKPASSTAAVLGTVIATKAGVDGDTAYLVAGALVAVGPYVASEIAEHGIKGAMRKLWLGRRG